MSSYFAGFSLGLSLILPIGSQNAFVLKQGLKNQYVLLVCCICALSDALLISAGAAGFGAIVKQFPTIETVARYGGALFLASYALFSFYSAATASQRLEASEHSASSMTKAALMCLGFTWLNPHVYLDTVVLLGSISTQYGEQQWQFTVGAMAASLVFFFSLGFGARLLAPVFNKPKAWKMLDLLMGLIMARLAWSLVSSASL
ncbi:LysE/ArgO family amino acid transporter [Ferrimonas senticii]|uniref:LysE/ArgO family amino acid transporter n=1 Tax=Ferrimonas senticii TaxID=394566 RepID=UPI0004012CBF|nr:LysE/ArgO family amino acid transporter [Ferrimonas senticii]